MALQWVRFIRIPNEGPIQGDLGIYQGSLHFGGPQTQQAKKTVSLDLAPVFQGFGRVYTQCTS